MRYTDAAYRSSAARQANAAEPGFQGAPRSTPGGGSGGYRHPAPASNDNYRRPANDNSPVARNRGEPRGGVPGWRDGLSKKGRNLLKGALKRAVPNPLFDLGQALIPGQIQHARPYTDDNTAKALGVRVRTEKGRFNIPFACLHSGSRVPPHGVSGIGDVAACRQLQATPVEFFSTPESSSDRVYGTVDIGAGVPSFHFVNWYEPFPGVKRWRTSNYADRVAPGSDRAVVGTRYGSSIEPHWPLVPGWVDPMSIPFGSPVVYPDHPPYRALPERRINPNRSRTDRSSWGPRVAARPSHWPRLAPYSSPVTRVNVSAFPGRQTTTSRPRPAAHHNLPPRDVSGGRTRESKVRLGGPLARAVNAAVGAATETMDWIAALWWALPSQYRSKGYTNPWQKAQDIYNNLQHMDWGRAAQNIILMQAQDAAIAAGSRARVRGYRDAGFEGALGVDPGNWASKGFNRL